MPELREHRPAPAAPDRTPRPRSDLARAAPNASSPWSDRVAAWLRSTADAVCRTLAGEPVVDRFAELAAPARDPEEVRVELVRLASKISGAARVELFGDRNGRIARRLACWPPSLPPETTPEPRSSPRGPIAGPVARSIKERPAPLTLQLPLKAGDTSIGTLRLTARGRRPWSARVVRTPEHPLRDRLGRRARPRPTASGRADPSFDARQGPQGSTILAAFLAFAHAQARRRHEPLSLLEVGGRPPRLDPRAARRRARRGGHRAGRPGDQGDGPGQRRRRPARRRPARRPPAQRLARERA